MAGDWVTSIDGTDVAALGFSVLDTTDFGYPALRRVEVDIPGRDGVLDLTDAITGYPNYDPRDISLELITFTREHSEFVQAVDSLRRLCHGKRLDFTLGAYPDYTYTGRFEVCDVDYDGWRGSVIVDIRADPWRLKEEIEDTFTLSTTRTRSYECGMRPQNIVVTSPGVVVACDGVEVYTEGDSQKIYDFTLTPDVVNSVTFSLISSAGDTWDDSEGYTWDDCNFAWSDVYFVTVARTAYTWDGLGDYDTWEKCAFAWQDAYYTTDDDDTDADSSATVIVKYRIEDL